MYIDDQAPTFNLKAVVKETGLKPDTLRAWERRYGLPKPQRSSGGHRLYSQHDIEILKWLMARQEEGLSISKAVDLWNRLEAEGQDPLAAVAVPEAGPGFGSIPVGGNVAEMREAWLSACLDFDEQRAEQILTQAFALYPPEVVCLEVLREGLAQIGDEWYQGEVSVQQEHFASVLAIRRLEALIAAAPAPTRPGRILTACPPQEEHTFSPLLITFLLRRQGWDVLYMGANVPLARLEEALAKVRPKLVILSAQLLHTAATLLEMAHLLQQQHVPLAFGGAAFNSRPELRARIPGHFLGEHLEMVPQLVEKIVATPHLTPPVEAIPEPDLEALSHYRELLPLIEAHVSEAMQQAGISYQHLSTANEHIARDIMAALSLGDISLLGDEIAWVEGLLINYQIPADLLHRYLNTYYQVANTYLDERGEPILGWLAQLNSVAS
jgi:DNA-binding transcriptional MerR regulator/methylmalonyl-CoA mutase cobalamin-binding subunit